MAKKPTGKKSSKPKGAANPTSKQKNLPAPSSSRSLVPLKGKTIKKSCSAAGHHLGRAKPTASKGKIKVNGSSTYNARAQRTTGTTASKAGRQLSYCR